MKGYGGPYQCLNEAKFGNLERKSHVSVGVKLGQRHAQAPRGNQWARSERPPRSARTSAPLGPLPSGFGGGAGRERASLSPTPATRRRGRDGSGRGPEVELTKGGEEPGRVAADHEALPRPSGPGFPPADFQPSGSRYSLEALNSGAPQAPGPRRECSKMSTR
ncbi:hypothetical protein J1605_022643 [Eschrichtius robustus]|uniref:Uncharacterized protein n=1 Tax=Eschrichtius robustus TaxID=9764 RepID=A0AB34H9H0_ESCRO|nr:hypothetical protein J1605_022643 [Eschrichtius robustus]